MRTGLERAGLRILLADDEQAHQHLLRRAVLRSCDTADVRVVETADECLAALERERFDCAVIDFHLPGADADRLLRDCEPRLAGCPVIVVSADGDQRVAVDAFRCLGVVDFVSKSEAVSGDALWRSIEHAVGQARQQMAERRRAERRERYLVKLAETDPLTGLANRRYVERCRQQGRWARDRRGGMACVMVDLDRFKQINDTHGHAVGDRVLVAVAHAVAAAADPADVVARWGGEEFLVLRPSARITDAWCWADDLRRRVRAVSIETPDGPVRPTVSVGVACVTTERFGPAAIDHADRALYLAKTTGRDRTCTWTMARVVRLADAVAARVDVPDDPIARYHALIAAARPLIGPTQRDHLTDHADRVAAMADSLANLMCVDDATRRVAHIAGQLHDAGKLAVPESLLARPRRLRLAEHRLVARHADVGAAIVDRLGAEPAVADAIRQHHTRFDRRPSDAEGGLSVVARILAVADALVTMTSARPYAEVLTIGDALAELRRGAGAQFDPQVVAAAHFIDAARLADAA